MCSKTVRSNHPWFDHDAKRLKLQWRLAEKCWLRCDNNADRTLYMLINKCYLRHLYQSKKSYINSQLESSNNKSQTLFKMVQQLMIGQQDNPLPDSSWICWLLSSAIGWAYCNHPNQMSVCGGGGWVCLFGCVLAIFWSHIDCCQEWSL